MNRAGWMWSILIALVLTGVVVAAVVYPPRLQEQRLMRAISRYNSALSEALSSLSERPLVAVAHPSELTRIATYMVLLDGTDTVVDTRMLDIEVRDVRSAPPTHTVETVEQWRYSERDRNTGRIKQSPRIESNSMRYTLVESDGRILVYRSELLSRTVDASE